MNKVKLDYAKKLIKFGKSVEAQKVLESLVSESPDQFLVNEALEIILFDIELGKKKIVLERILPLLETIKKQKNFPENKILEANKIIESMKINSILKEDLKFTAEFLDLIEFFKNDFLKNSIKIKDYKYSVVDFNSAIELAHNQNIEKPFMSWNQLRTNTNKAINNIIFNNNIDDKKFKNISDSILKQIEPRIKNYNEVFYYFLDDVLADSYMLMKASYVGYKDTLINSMVECYKSLNFPCGWEGEYPQGKLCIYKE